MILTSNKAAEKYTTCCVELVFCEFDGPIDPVVRDSFKYTISIADFVYLKESDEYDCCKISISGWCNSILQYEYFENR